MVRIKCGRGGQVTVGGKPAGAQKKAKKTKPGAKATAAGKGAAQLQAFVKEGTSDITKMQVQYCNVFGRVYDPVHVDRWIASFVQATPPPRGSEMAGGIAGRQYRARMKTDLKSKREYELYAAFCIRSRQLQARRHAATTAAKRVGTIAALQTTVAQQAAVICALEQRIAGLTAT